MKKKSRVFIAILLVGFAVVLLAMFFVLRNLDSFIEAAIEAYGSDAAGVPVEVEKVNIQLREGVGTIDRLSVSNPHGFSNNPIFNLEEIRLDLIPGSIGSGITVIEEIRIKAPTFLYEINENGKINLNVIRENLRQFAAAREDQKKTDEKPPLRLRIERLIVEKGRTIFDLSAVGGKRRESELPRIVLSDIGGENGVTPNGLAEVVFSALLRELQESAARQGIEKAIRDRMEEETGTMKEKLEEKFGPGADDTPKNGG